MGAQGTCHIGEDQTQMQEFTHFYNAIIMLCIWCGYIYMVVVLTTAVSSSVGEVHPVDVPCPLQVHIPPGV